MSRSLWVDETLTYWVVKDGFLDLIYCSIHFQGQSPLYYLVVLCFIQILGHSEWVLRLPSLLSLLIACPLLYRLFLVFFNREAGLISVLIFISLWDLMSGCSARPYALAVMFSLLSVICFVLWIQTGQTRHKIVYIIASTATCYAHILFAPILFVHFCYFLINRESGSKVSFKRLFFTFGLIVVCLLPNTYQLMLLSKKKELYAISPIPSVINLIHAWFPLELFIPLIAGFLIALIVEKKMYWKRDILHSKQFFFFLIWFFSPALFLFVTSIISGTSLFLYRYYCWSSPAVALVITNLIIAMKPERARVITVVFFCILIILGRIVSPKPPEDWRAAADYINSTNIANKGAVLLWPGLAEHRNWEWSKKPDKRDYLLAPFSFYPLQKEAILLPNLPDGPEIEEFLSQHDILLMKQKDEICLIVRNILIKGKTMQKAQTSLSIYEDWLQQNGFFIIQRKNFGGIIVTRFSPHSDA